MNAPLHMVPDAIREALELTGLPWSVERGTRHYHVRLAGHLVGVLPGGSNPHQESNLRPTKNIVANIRRLARELNPQPVEIKAPPKPKPAPKPPSPQLRLVAPAPPPAPRAPTPRWRPGLPTPPLRGEPGWRGVFTREQAPGALPNGTRVVKVRGDGQEREGAWIGERGTVLGSIICPDRPARLYFIEWDKSPRTASATMGRKIESLKENPMDWRNYAQGTA